MNNFEIKHRLVKKALQGICRCKVSALGFNSKGELVAKAVNRPRFSKKGGSVHAEQQLFLVAKRKGIKTIFICRISRNGNMLPIDPCYVCKDIAEKMNIKIISI